MNNYYDDSDVTARYGYKVAEDPTVVPEGVCVITDVIHGDIEEISTQYCHKGCAQEANQAQLPIIGRSERGTHVVFSST